MPQSGYISDLKDELIIGRVLAGATRKLECAEISRPDFEAQYLLLAVLHINKASLFLSLENKMSARQVERFGTMVGRRIHGEPLQYIVGSVEFWSKIFHLTPDVLIPRHETEFVLEQTIALLKHWFPCPEKLQVLDMGTGSGVIADVLAGELGCHVLACDISSPALAVAAGNIAEHQLENLVTLVCSDLFEAISTTWKFDCIIANPPYVAEHEKEELADEVIQFEPGQALFAGDDGLDCYRRLIPESYAFLHSGGWLMLEIGASQGEAVSLMLRDAGYQNINIRSDYCRRPRFACGRKQ